MIANLFVYGTLRRGYDHEFARLLAATARFVGAAQVRGRIYKVAAYPGLVLSDDAAEQVRGDVFELNDPDETLRVLDEYEGSEYRRVAVTARLLDAGRTVDAWAYIYSSDVTGKPLILSGDFLA